MVQVIAKAGGSPAKAGYLQVPELIAAAKAARNGEQAKACYGATKAVGAPGGIAAERVGCDLGGLREIG